MLNPNDGDRLSKLTLDRYATGELSDEERAEVEAKLDDRARAHLAELEAARSQVAPFDVARLRARAGAEKPLPRADVAPPPTPKPANTARGWQVWVPLLAVAALLLAALLPGLRPGPGTEGDVRFRSAEALQVYQLQEGLLQPYAGSAVGEGDTLGFKVSATGKEGVVVLSVDGTGQVSVFWPAAGDAPEPLRGDGLVPLDGSVVLDGAPGPEVFVAVFDTPVSEAKAEVQRAFQSGGHAGLLEWAQLSEGADAVAVTRR